MSHPTTTERCPRAVPRRGKEYAAPPCRRGALRCSRHEGGRGSARRGAARATTAWLLAGAAPAGLDVHGPACMPGRLAQRARVRRDSCPSGLAPSRRCASRRPIFAPTGYRPRSRDALRLFVDACHGGAGQSRGRVCAGSDICGAEERKAHGRARSALQLLTRRDCSSATTAGSEASFAAGHETEHRREPGAKRRAAASERRRITGRGFASLGRCVHAWWPR
jgi:hypothetical protein